MSQKNSDIPVALTFDDVLLLPAASKVLPNEVDVRTKLTRAISMNIPLMSAAMDTVTEANTAISMAREGGIGIIHKNMSIERQAREVDKVKKSESGMIIDPVTMHPEQKISEVLEVMERYRISGVPIVEDGRKLVGIITNRDLRFETNLDQKVAEVMTKENLVTASEGITLEESKILLHKNRIEKLLVVNDKGDLLGLITIKDIMKIKKYPNACKDSLCTRPRPGGGGQCAGDKTAVSRDRAHSRERGHRRRGQNPCQGWSRRHQDRCGPRLYLYYEGCRRCGSAADYRGDGVCQSC
jgi:IMP dehydrogenase